MKKIIKSVSFLVLLVFLPNAYAFMIGTTPTQKWGGDGFGVGGGTISFGFTTSAFCPLTDCNPADVVGLETFMPTGFESEISNAFAAWSAVADIDFVMASDPEDAQIKIAGDNGIEGNGLAYAWYPTVGDVFFNPKTNWSLADTGTSSSIFLVALHEIGHSLGLDHSFDGTVMHDFINPNLTGLTADDIAGIQAIYGERLVTAVPLPAAFWMMLVGLVSLAPFPRKQSQTI